MANTNNNSDMTNLLKYIGQFNNPYLSGITSGRSYIFITKPLLFLSPRKPNSATDTKGNLAYKNMTKDPFFTSYLDSENSNELDKVTINSLSYDLNLYPSRFLRIFSNLAMNFTPTDLNLETIETTETRSGYKFELPVTDIRSTLGGDISLRFSETSNLDVTKTTALWVKYIKCLMDGTFRTNPDMITNKEIDYMSSLYYFFLGEDGQTIKYYCRLTGLYPTGVPYSAFAHDEGSSNRIELDIPFKYTIKQEMDPLILEDFNRVALYDLNFESQYSSDSSLDYNPIKDSEILNLNKLLVGQHKDTIANPYRDPIVYYEMETENRRAGYRLSFPKSTVSDNYVHKILDYDEDDLDIYRTTIDDE